MGFFDKLKKKDKTVVLDTKIQNAIDEKRFRATNCIYRTKNSISN